jgi:hypothetical protein
MKTSAEKSSTTTPTRAAHASNQPFFAKAGMGSFFAPATESATPSLQMKLAVNKPGDKFEQEADKMADKVMRMPSPALPRDEKIQRQADEKLRRKEDDKIQKAVMPEEKIQKVAAPEEKIQKKEDEKLQKAPASEEKPQRNGDGAPAVAASVQSGWWPAAFQRRTRLYGATL